MPKRCLLYLLSIMSVFFINIIYPQYAFFIILLILLILPVISIVYTLLVKERVTITFELKEDVTIRGDQNIFSIVIDNDAFFTLPNIMINLDFYYNNYDKEIRSQYRTDARNMHKTIITGKMDATHAGELQISIKESFVYDPLKLIKIRLRCSCSKKMLVMPILTEPDFYSLYTTYDDLDDAKDYSQNRSGDDTSEIFDIRNYHNGDNINRIHWKAAAKQDDLMVKDFSLPIFNSNCILLELNKVSDELQRDGLDGVFEMVYAIGNLACTKEKQFKLAYHCNMSRSLKVYEIKNHQDLVEAIQNMLHEPSYIGNLSFYDYLENEFNESCKLFYITTQLDDHVYEQLNQPRDCKTSVFYIQDSQDAGEVTQLEGAMLVKVDHNDIKQGLKNVIL